MFFSPVIRAETQPGLKFLHVISPLATVYFYCKNDHLISLFESITSELVVVFRCQLLLVVGCSCWLLYLVVTVVVVGCCWLLLVVVNCCIWLLVVLGCWLLLVVVSCISLFVVFRSLLYFVVVVFRCCWLFVGYCCCCCCLFNFFACYSATSPNERP